MDKFKDDLIKQKFQKDKFISNEANNVFEKFKKENLSNQNELNDKTNDKTNATNKVVNIAFYKRMRSILSVAAVFVCIIVAGGVGVKYTQVISNNNATVDYTNNNVKPSYENIKYGKEEIVSESENNLVKAYLIRNKEVIIQLKNSFIKAYNLNISEDNQYVVKGINKGIKDIFVGCIVDEKHPYVLLLMEDGTAECVQILYDVKVPEGNYQFEFTTQGVIEGLDNVVGFEQQTRKFSYSPDLYYYINAIRKDGKKKEIELGVYNDWNDKSTRTYDRLNQKYIKDFDSNAIVDDGTDDVIQNSKIIYNLSIEHNYSYYMLEGKFYRIDNTNQSETCLAEGVNGIVRDNTNGKLTVLLNKNYKINEIDKNIIYNESDVVTTSDVTASAGSDGIFVEKRRDGSLTIVYEIGMFEKLGIKQNETNLRENVRYNIYGSSYGEKNKLNNIVNAAAKAFTIWEVAPDSAYSLVYAKNDDTIICMDLADIVKKSDIHLVKKVITGASNVVAFKGDTVYEDVNGQKVEKYRTLFTIERRENVTFYNREINYY